MILCTINKILDSISLIFLPNILLPVVYIKDDDNNSGNNSSNNSSNNSPNGSKENSNNDSEDSLEDRSVSEDEGNNAPESIMDDLDLLDKA
jgi:hypothetical protein